VIDAAGNAADIARAIRLALSDGFRRGLPATVAPYGGPGASLRIKNILKGVAPSVRKPFFDIAHEE
jgi:hypothetical protein